MTIHIVNQLSLQICGDLPKSFCNLPNFFCEHACGARTIFHLWWVKQSQLLVLCLKLEKWIAEKRITTWLRGAQGYLVYKLWWRNVGQNKQTSRGEEDKQNSETGKGANETQKQNSKLGHRWTDVHIEVAPNFKRYWNWCAKWRVKFHVSLSTRWLGRFPWEVGWFDSEPGFVGNVVSVGIGPQAWNFYKKRICGLKWEMTSQVAERSESTPYYCTRKDNKKKKKITMDLFPHCINIIPHIWHFSIIPTIQRRCYKIKLYWPVWHLWMMVMVMFPFTAPPNNLKDNILISGRKVS